MTWFFVVLIVLVIGAAVVVATGRGASMREVYGDRCDVAVPADRPLRAETLRQVRFTTVLRGYRMDEVDALLVRICAELAERDGADDQ